MIKNALFTLMLISFSSSLFSQSIGIGTTTPNANALLELKSSNKGLLIPRLFTSQVNLLSLTNSDEGLMVYDKNADHLLYWDGSEWVTLTENNQLWEESTYGIRRLDGNVAIGQYPTTVDKFSILNEDERTTVEFTNSYSGISAKYGIQNAVGGENTSVTYGIQNLVSVNDASSSTIYGAYTSVTSGSASSDIFGNYSRISGTGPGVKYAYYGFAEGANDYAGYFRGNAYVDLNLGLGVTNPAHKLDISNTEERAINIETTSAINDTVWGLKNILNAGGDGVRYGAMHQVDVISNFDRTAFGVAGIVKNSGLGTNIGVYGKANGSSNIGVFGESSGTGYAVYGENNNFSGYAGYFNGRTYSENYIQARDKIYIKPAGHGGGAEIEMFDDDGTETIKIRAGQSTSNGAEMLMYNDAGELTIELDADFSAGKGRMITGELEITGGSDLAEHFDIIGEEKIEAGMLVSIDPNSTGKLVLSQKAYDKKIAGVISGANGVNPGMLMGQRESIADGDYPVALTGRVYVLADASSSSIKPGDLLCSSSLPGYAMKAKNQRKAKGAIVGKAMTALASGKGYVLILVNLQ